MNSAAQLRMRLELPPERKVLTVAHPVHGVVNPSFVVGGPANELPTLASVERVNGILAALGLVLADPGDLDAIARVLNQRYVIVPYDEWQDCTIGLRVEDARTASSRDIVDAIQRVRGPTLEAAGEVLRSSRGARHDIEVTLTDELVEAVRRDQSVWGELPERSMAYLCRTLLPAIVSQLIAVPIADLIRSALHGLRRLS